jgi:exonuclease III
MKIATWNVERLKHKAKLETIVSAIDNLNADILVLTETDTAITPTGFKNIISTAKLIEIEPKKYAETEQRVSIFTNYEIVNSFETFDKYTAVCAELKTDLGNLKVYGTIIGIYGNRNENFNLDLAKQIIDFEKLSKDNNLCIIGDYNISFADNYYFTVFGREELNKSFELNNIELATRERKECIDHIAISKKIIENKNFEIAEWNESKSLSDHKGIYINIK